MQFCSSDESPHSSQPLHNHDLRMHLPLLQWKWSSSQMFLVGLSIKQIILWTKEEVAMFSWRVLPMVKSRTKPFPPLTESPVLNVKISPEPEKTNGGSDNEPQYRKLTVSCTGKLNKGCAEWEGMLNIESHVSPQHGLVLHKCLPSSKSNVEKLV